MLMDAPKTKASSVKLYQHCVFCSALSKETFKPSHAFNITGIVGYI